MPRHNPRLAHGNVAGEALYRYTWKKTVDFGNELPPGSGTYRQTSGARQTLRRPSYLALAPID